MEQHTGNEEVGPVAQEEKCKGYKNTRKRSIYKLKKRKISNHRQIKSGKNIWHKEWQIKVQNCGIHI